MSPPKSIRMGLQSNICRLLLSLVIIKYKISLQYFMGIIKIVIVKQRWPSPELLKMHLVFPAVCSYLIYHFCNYNSLNLEPTLSINTVINPPQQKNCQSNNTHYLLYHIHIKCYVLITKWNGIAIYFIVDR